MMFSIKTPPTLNAELASDLSRHVRRTPAPRRLRALAATIVARLRDLAPYAVIELVLPGGSVMALLLWLYRRQKKASVLAHSLQPIFD
jgi:hypothetical protein